MVVVIESDKPHALKPTRPVDLRKMYLSKT